MSSVELGCLGHFICAERCRWRRHTEVGGLFRVSSVGEFYATEEGNMEEIGCDRFYETMVFRLSPEPSSNDCDCHKTQDLSELECDGYQTAKEANSGHNRMVAKYEGRLS